MYVDGAVDNFKLLGKAFPRPGPRFVLLCESILSVLWGGSNYNIFSIIKKCKDQDPNNDVLRACPFSGRPTLTVATIVGGGIRVSLLLMRADANVNTLKCVPPFTLKSTLIFYCIQIRVGLCLIYPIGLGKRDVSGSPGKG